METSQTILLAKPPKFSLLEFGVPSALTKLKAGKPKRAKPIDYSESLPNRYNRQLQLMISAINEEIIRDLIPLIYRLKPEYTADAWPTMVSAMVNAITERWTGNAFKSQSERIAAGTIRRIDAENGQAFLNSVNQAVGVEVFGANSQGITTALEAAALENANLIKSIPQQYLTQVSEIVLDRMKKGYAPSVIAKDLQKQSGITRRRAKFIARDQTAKLNGSLTELRNKAAGIQYFRWNDSGDSRVGDDHRRAAKRDIGFGPGVYRWDKPPREGIPGRSSRPNCFPGWVAPNFIPGIRRLYRRKYCGGMVEILTTLGERIVTTPNHPIITKRGWIAANMLNVGDNILGIDKNTLHISNVESDKTKASFSNLFDTLKVIFGQVSCGGLSGDFHGDGVIDNDVDIVDVDRAVGIELKFMGIQQSQQFDFARAVSSALCSMDSFSSFDFLGISSLHAPNSIVSCACSLQSLLSSHSSHADDVRLAAAANIYPILAKYSSDNISRYAKLLGDTSGANPALIGLANEVLIKVNLIVWGALVGFEFDPTLLQSDSQNFGVSADSFGNFRGVESVIVEVNYLSDEVIGESGHVYNLETKKGWYNIGSVTVKNCRCTASPVFEWELPNTA